MSGSGYERTEITSHFPLAVGSGEVKNISEVSFAIATVNWPELTHIGFMESDVENTADMIAYAPLDVVISILQNQSFIFHIDNLVVHLDY